MLPPSSLEDAASSGGEVRPGMSVATLRVSNRTRLRVVDALVTGQHEPNTSHYELLRAFQDDDVLDRAVGEANARGYRTHEFGDSLFMTLAVLRARDARPSRAARRKADSVRSDRERRCLAERAHVVPGDWRVVSGNASHTT